MKIFDPQTKLDFVTHFMRNFIRIQGLNICNRVTEVVRGHGGPPPKSLDWDENFKPEHMLFCSKLRFVAIYALFGDLWAKKVPFWVKTVLLGHYYMVLYCIFY